MAEFTFVERKPMDGREHALDAELTIGREGCDVVLPDPEVSRRHAALRVTGDGVAVEDFGSTNGTFVNEERVQGVRPLHDGDVVRFGNTEWELRGAAAPAPAGIAAPQVTAARAVPVEPPTVAQPAGAQTAAPPVQAPPAAAPPAAAGAPAAAAPVGPDAAADAAAPGLAGEGRRGDVAQPLEVTPSAIRRTLPEAAAAAPPAFSPVGTKQQRGSAATRAGYTAFCFAVFVATMVGVIVYFIVNGS
jgi:predicted component of type VI protein secretion system